MVERPEENRMKTGKSRNLFDRLVKSIKQAGKIHRGEMAPSRRFEVIPSDLEKMREALRKPRPVSRP